MSTTTTTLVDKLISICHQIEWPAEGEVVIPEPYIPFIPDEWNGILVLVEAQNLSSRVSGYVEWLESCSAEMRLRRLGNYSSDRIGVGPWDDGTLKLAIAAILSAEEIDRCAVSNAVPWSLRKASGANKRPTKPVIELSQNLWSAMLPELDPGTIITCGRIPRDVINAAARRSGWRGRHIKLHSPSQNYLSRIRGLFPSGDLLERYEEVRIASEQAGHLVEEKKRRNAEFFACHAVSTVLGGK